jgi:hypothetical protein
MNPLQGTTLTATRALLGDLIFDPNINKSVGNSETSETVEMVTNHNGRKVNKKLLDKWLKFYFEKGNTNKFLEYSDEVLELYVYIAENGLVGEYEYALAQKQGWTKITFDINEVQARFIEMGLYQ